MRVVQFDGYAYDIDPEDALRFATSWSTLPLLLSFQRAFIFGLVRSVNSALDSSRVDRLDRI